jgi:hypothetical protein
MGSGFRVRPCSVISAYLTVKVKAAELPPPGAGLFTRRLTVRGVTRSTAGIATRSVPDLTNTVLRAEPLQSATDPGTKWDPIIEEEVGLRVVGHKQTRPLANKKCGAVTVTAPRGLIDIEALFLRTDT